ncbi:hypothetical protein Pelo_13615 [Pelomyxa schiedti]|nr:hypothetical protein Pelo_13615 [Pelomyxa schiedti]
MVSGIRAAVWFVVSSLVVVCGVLAACYVEVWLYCVAHEYGHAITDLALFGTPPQVHVGCLPDDCECLLTPSLLPGPLAHWAFRDSFFVHKALPVLAFSGGLGDCAPGGGGSSKGSQIGGESEGDGDEADLGALDACVYWAGPLLGAIQWLCFTVGFWFFVAWIAGGSARSPGDPHGRPRPIAAAVGAVASPFGVIRGMAADPLSRFPCPAAIFCGALSCASAVSLGLFINRAMYGLFPCSLNGTLEFGGCLLQRGTMESWCMGDGEEVWRRFFGAGRVLMWWVWMATFIVDWMLRIVLTWKVIQVIILTTRTSKGCLDKVE